MIPVAFTTALLLHLLRISIDVTRLGKVAREMFFGWSSAVGECNVVTVVGFMGTSHYGPAVSILSLKLWRQPVTKLLVM